MDIPKIRKLLLKRAIVSWSANKSDFEKRLTWRKLTNEARNEIRKQLWNDCKRYRYQSFSECVQPNRRQRKAKDQGVSMYRDGQHWFMYV